MKWLCIMFVTTTGWTADVASVSSTLYSSLRSCNESGESQSVAINNMAQLAHVMLDTRFTCLPVTP
jgi:hypothetical protein